MGINLTGEQRRILSLPHNNPILIRGVAGSGKTTLAVLRAQHIAKSENDMYRGTNICIFSYTKSLVKFIRSLVDTELNPKITVIGFHAWAKNFLFEIGLWKHCAVVSQSDVGSILALAISTIRSKDGDHSTLNKPLHFYQDEIAWIKGKLILEKAEYLMAKRLGRGKTDRINARDKELLWEIYEFYCKQLQLKGLDRGITYIDYEDYALLALIYLDNHNDFIPPFSHIVVDEAQDLNASQLLVIKKIVNPETNSLTIIADAAQQIYKSGFTWMGLGINVRGGRSIELKHNYRNTYQIAEAAMSLLSHDPKGNDYSRAILPDRQGPKPKSLYKPNGTQLQYLQERLKGINLSDQSIVIVHRKRIVIGQLTGFLKDVLGYECKNICDREGEEKTFKEGLYTSTMHAIKGLEFDHVIICDLNDDIVPDPERIVDEAGELHIDTERRLLYTCMTRARQTLHLVSTGSASRYLAEINPSTIEQEGWSGYTAKT